MASARGANDCEDYSQCTDAFALSTASPHVTIDESRVAVNQTTTFSGGLTPGPGDARTITGYLWNFGNGDTSTAATAGP